MSLFRQLWLTVLLVTLVSFTGSLIVSLFTTQNYLEQQLHRKNIDSANSLAYSISQLNKDPVTIDLQVAALFDSGQYERITITSPDGRVMTERIQGEVETGAPGWFTKLYPISAPPGVAQISDTWMTFGMLNVVSNARFAQEVLWHQAKSLLIWFLAAGLFCGLTGMLILRRVNEPLATMVEQADAITERRFLTIAEPRIPELRSIARATNDMIRRLHNRSVEEAARIESTRKLVNYDPVTGLANREHFMNRFLEILEGNSAAAPERNAEKTAPGQAEGTVVKAGDKDIQPEAENGTNEAAIPRPRQEEVAARDGGSQMPGVAVQHDAAAGALPNTVATEQEAAVAPAAAAEAGPVVADRMKSGILFLVRVNDLRGINQALGRTGANDLLREISTVVGNVAAAAWHGEPADPLAARLNGSDFALVVPGADQAGQPAQQLTAELSALSRRHEENITDLYHIGAVRYQHADMLGELLASADAALATAERKGANSWHAAPALADHTPPALNIGDWRHIFSNAFAEDRFELAFHPVAGRTGDMLHEEVRVRMQAQPNGGWLDAADFVSIAARLQLAASLDLTVIRHALDTLEKRSGDLAITLSAETIADSAATGRIMALLQPNPERCKRLWLEVPEYDAFRNPESVKDFCQRFRALGCRTGIGHLSRHVTETATLAGLGVDYLKVDASLVHGINQSRRNQKFLRLLCGAAHDADIIVMASGVQNEAEQKALLKLGFDGLAGPGLK